MFKLKQVLKDINTLFLLLRVYADDVEKLKAEVEMLKPKKKVVTKTVVKTQPKTVTKKTTK